jgi:NADPH:quinone reductase-like Zn-dependent oxidoreductase
MPLRREIWGRLGGDLRIDDIDQFVTKEIGLGEILASAADLIDRRLIGRTVVTV